LLFPANTLKRGFESAVVVADGLSGLRGSAKAKKAKNESVLIQCVGGVPQ
jgi:hypothetical protein